jgi:hypothetical protein
MEKHTAPSGKVWKSKITQQVYSSILILAKEDTLDNWEQVDKPIEPEPEEEVVDETPNTV